MGNCFGSGGTTITSINKTNQTGVSSAREKKVLTRGASSMINMSDFMGIKKSDSIDNFYKIETVIGRGKFLINFHE